MGRGFVRRTIDVKEVVKQKYGEAALRVRSGGSCCCGASPGSGCADPITTNLYDAAQIGQVAEDAVRASRGCGNPTALAQWKLGETVLEPGCGGGIDVLLTWPPLHRPKAYPSVTIITKSGGSQEPVTWSDRTLVLAAHFLRFSNLL